MVRVPAALILLVWSVFGRAVVLGGVSDWTWLNGSSSGQQNGTYGTQGVAASANVPGGRQGTATWRVGGTLWLFGGQGYGEAAVGYLNDLWSFDLNAGEWTWVDGPKTSNGSGTYGSVGVPAPSNVPGGRERTVTWVDGSGVLWLFGGIGYDGSGGAGQLNDLWKFDPGTGQWTWVGGSSTVGAFGVYGSKGVSAGTNWPGAREAASGWIDGTGKLWLFGGSGRATTTTGFLNDVWCYDPVSGEWTWVNGSSETTFSGIAGVYGSQGTASASNLPGSRGGAATFLDGASNTLWLFGGSGVGESLLSGQGVLNDLWSYDLASGEWTWQEGSKSPFDVGNAGTIEVPAASNQPGSREHARMWVDGDGSVWLFGGAGFDTSGGLGFGDLDDLWRYDSVTGFWTWMKGSGTASAVGVYGVQGTAAPTNRPGARSLSGIWDSQDGRTLHLFGGFGSDASTGSVALNDLWSYQAVGSAYETWAGAAGLSGADALPTSTPFNEGVENLLKFAFNMNGSTLDNAVLTPGTGVAGLPAISVTIAGSSGILRIEFVRRTDGSVGYAPMKSETLGGASWVPLTDTPDVTAIDSDWERVIYEEPFDAETVKRLFGRMDVTLN